MNDFSPILPEEHCTGCEACRWICPAKAIRMLRDSKGFLRPTIDLSCCINCGLCVRRCPALQKKTVFSTLLKEQKVYAAWSRNRSIVKRSSSGGLFSELALEIFKMNGVVFGARWTDEMKLIHDYCESPEKLVPFCGSKYVQSEIGESYRTAKRFLEEGRQVLFSGTPCQIAGLKGFLGKDYPNLLCVDFLCHGVPSLFLFQDYLRELGESSDNRIVEYRFRNKKYGWISPMTTAHWESGKIFRSFAVNNSYYMGFVKNLFLRSCCYHCRYAKPLRIGDITLADFWGYQPHKVKFWSFHFGCSCVIVNNTNGKRFFERIRNRCVVDERTLAEVAKFNTTLNGPVMPHPHVEEFWRKYEANRGFHMLCSKFCPVNRQNSFLLRLLALKARYRFLLPNWMASLARKVKKLRN